MIVRRVLHAHYPWLVFAAVAQFSIAYAAPWSPAMNVHPQTDSPDGYPEIVATPDGTTWITWMGIDPLEGDEEAFFSRWNGNAWEAAGTVNPPNQSDDRFPRFSCAPLGGLWVTWTSPEADGTSYCGLASRWTGASWSLPDTIWTGGGRYDYVETQAVSESEAWFVRDGLGSGGLSDIFVYHMASGVRDPVVQFAIPSTDEFLPSITVGQDGEPWVAWKQIPGPPPNPSLTRLQFSRRHSGVWSEPDTIPAPTAINRLRIIAGADAHEWIICSAPDPSVGPFSSAIWSLESSGSGWLPPLRISNQIAAVDSEQYQLSVGQTCGGYPRPVWLVRNIDIYTRADILTTSYNGTDWSPVERAGQLSDSAYVHWPAISYSNGRTWVAYMRDVPPTFVSNVFTTYSDGIPTAATFIEVSTACVDGGVWVSWRESGISRASLARVWRAPGFQEQPQPTTLAQVVENVDVETSGTLDSGAEPGHTYTYWVEATDGRTTLWGGPSTVSVPDTGRGLRIAAISPNPSRGEVRFECLPGSRRTVALEVFDVVGRLVRSLPVATDLVGSAPTGTVTAHWDGRNARAIILPSGVYFARLREVGSTAASGPVRFVLIH